MRHMLVAVIEHGYERCMLLVSLTFAVKLGRFQAGVGRHVVDTTRSQRRRRIAWHRVWLLGAREANRAHLSIESGFPSREFSKSIGREK